MYVTQKLLRGFSAYRKFPILNLTSLRQKPDTHPSSPSCTQGTGSFTQMYSPHFNLKDGDVQVVLPGTGFVGSSGRSSKGIPPAHICQDSCSPGSTYQWQQHSLQELPSCVTGIHFWWSSLYTRSSDHHRHSVSQSL